MDDRTPNANPITKSATEARQADKTGVVRWVLLFSTVATIIGMIVAYWIVRGF
jgi:hypothetical protein